MLAVTQVALSFVLLVEGALLVESFVAFRATDLGFKPRNALSLFVTLSEDQYPNRTTRVGFYEDVLRGLWELPGVESGWGC